MTNVFRFTGSEVRDLSEQIRTDWQAHISEKIPEGWSVSPIDFSALVANVPCLKIKPEYKIAAYQFRQGRDGNTKVFAIPQDVTLPQPDVDEDDEFIEPSPPSMALGNIAEVIIGDRTPWSYLCASILVRELFEVGAFGHGTHWAAFHVLDEPPETSDGQPWQWQGTKPESWSPVVNVNETSVKVEFFTYCGLGSERITHHQDIYLSPNSYHFDSHEELIAQAFNGYVW